MNNEDIFANELKKLLLSRKRMGGGLFWIKRSDFSSNYSDNLRTYLTSEVLEFVGKNSYCFILEESSNDSLRFLDVTRGIRANGDTIDILGFFYENGQVESYVIDKYKTNIENNG